LQPQGGAPHGISANPHRQRSNQDLNAILRAVNGSTLWSIPMTDHIYKIVELAGASTESIEDAIQTAIKRANQTLRNLRWFEVVQTRGHIENGAIQHYQVVLKVGFTMEESGE
jgi:hypothetical protein